MVLTDTGDKENYDTSDFSPESLLNNIQKSEGRRGFVKKDLYTVWRDLQMKRSDNYIYIQYANCMRYVLRMMMMIKLMGLWSNIF